MFDTQDARQIPVRTLTADRLVHRCVAARLDLPALALARETFLTSVTRLGSRFFGNGDLLTFAINCSESVDGRRSTTQTSMEPGGRSSPRHPGLDTADGATDAATTSRTPAIRVCQLDARSCRLAAGVAAAVPMLARLFAKWLSRRPERDLTARSFPPRAGIDGTLRRPPALGRMGRELVPDGVMKLIDDKLDIEWNLEHSRPHFDRVRRTMRAITRELGGTFVDNPTWHLSRVITVHPLGGCPMGRSADEGVVDAWGRVFNYKDLYVADGAVMPGPVGANPSLTIAALADRFADGILDAKRSAA